MHACMQISDGGMAGLCGWASFAAAYKLWEGRAGDYVNRYLTISGLAFLFAIGSVVVFWKVARLEMTPKLFTLTFLLVAYDGSDLTSASLVLLKAWLLPGDGPACRSAEDCS